MLPDVFDGIRDFDDPLSAPVGRFQWNNDEVRRTERSEAHKAQPWRAIDEDVVVVAAHLLNRFCEVEVQVAIFPGVAVGNVELAERSSGRQDVDMRVGAALDQLAGVGFGAWIEKRRYVGEVRGDGFEKATGEVGLRVGVDCQSVESGLLAHAKHRPDGVGFANAAFQIDDRDDGGAVMCGSRHGASVARLNDWSHVFPRPAGQ